MYLYVIMLHILIRLYFMEYEKMRNRFGLFLCLVFIINIIISVILFWWLLKYSGGYVLSIDSNNQEKVIALLKEAKLKIDDKKHLTKIRSKQGLGDVYIFLYYQEENAVDNNIVGDNEEINKYLRKEGKKVGEYQEKTFYLLNITLIIIIILIIINEILYKWQEKKKNITIK